MATVTFLPDKKFVPAFTANGNEHRISYLKLTDRNSLIGSMGGSFPVGNISVGGIEAQGSLASSVYTRLNSAGVRFQVVDVDFFVDLMLDIRLSPATTMRFGWGHTSHHLADDAFESLGFTRSINYARDYYQWMVIHRLPILSGFVYGGTYYTYSFLIDRRMDGQFLLQAGGEFLNYPLLDDLTFYCAFDVKLRSELAYGSTQSYQAGVKVHNGSLRAVRLAYTLRTGIEERGQFYDRRATLHLAGIYFDL